MNVSHSLSQRCSLPKTSSTFFRTLCPGCHWAFRTGGKTYSCLYLGCPRQVRVVTHPTRS